VAALLALVADLLATGRLLGAVTGVVARLATVVALHAVNTFACGWVRTYTTALGVERCVRDMWP
jgi:hypothetical protein